jgi:hypothetical protein
MTLQAGCGFVVAPHFQSPIEWAERLLVGSGVQEIGSGVFLPHDSWRAPTADELSVLVDRAPARGSHDAGTSLCLYQLPQHLQTRWWELLEQSAEMLGVGPVPGFDAFVSEVGEFLAFKRVPVPAGARFNAIVSSGTAGPEASRAAFRCNLAASAAWPIADDDCGPGIWGAINLGTEDASVVLIHLSCRQLDAELRRRFPDKPSPGTVGDLTEHFLRACPGYPPIRLILRPGEGYRLPRGGIVVADYSGTNPTPDVLLSICRESPDSI